MPPLIHDRRWTAIVNRLSRLCRTTPQPGRNCQPALSARAFNCSSSYHYRKGMNGADFKQPVSFRVGGDPGVERLSPDLLPRPVDISLSHPDRSRPPDRGSEPDPVDIPIERDP
jgi:hypothetical protein